MRGRKRCDGWKNTHLRLGMAWQRTFLIVRCLLMLKCLLAICFFLFPWKGNKLWWVFWTYSFVLCTELQNFLAYVFLFFAPFFFSLFVCWLQFLVSNDIILERVSGFCLFLSYPCSPVFTFNRSLLFSFLEKSAILQSCIGTPQNGKNWFTQSEMFGWLYYALCLNDCVMLCVWVVVSCFV